MSTEKHTVTVKNVTDGIRYLNTVGGPIGLSPGEVAEKVEMTATEMKVARDTGWFEFEEADKSAPVRKPARD